MKKIVLIGPESTGKTTLCQQLAEYFSTEWVAEYARDYVQQLQSHYTYDDVEHIAKVQLQQFEKKNKGDGVIFFDTDLIITKIWFQVRYNQIPEWLNNAINKQNISLYLLCKPDLKWQNDGVRENADNRSFLYDCYKKEIEQISIPYFEIEGLGNKRLNSAIKAVKLFNKK